MMEEAEDDRSITVIVGYKKKSYPEKMLQNPKNCARDLQAHNC